MDAQHSRKDREAHSVCEARGDLTGKVLSVLLLLLFRFGGGHGRGARHRVGEKDPLVELQQVPIVPIEGGIAGTQGEETFRRFTGPETRWNKACVITRFT